MAIEKIRGCGFRKVGGTYLIGEGMMVPCDRLPISLEVCPVCGQGIKITTGYTQIYPERLFGGKHKNCTESYSELCPVCNPQIAGKEALLMWVGSRFYSPESFIAEAKERNVCKRIPFILSNLEIGKTWIYLAHKEAYKKVINQYRTDLKPGVFYAFKPTRIEKLIWKSEADEKTLEKLKKRGITPVVIPDGDPDHDPNRSVWTDLKLHKEKKEK